jgi:hypothetical protein
LKATLRITLALLLALSLAGCDIFDSDDDKDDLPTVPPAATVFTGATIEAQAAVVQNQSCLLRAVGEWTGGKNPTTANWSSTSPRVSGNFSSGPVNSNSSIFDITVQRGVAPISEDVRLIMNLVSSEGATFRAERTVSLVCPASASLPLNVELSPLGVAIRWHGQALQGAHLEQVLREMGR